MNQVMRISQAKDLLGYMPYHLGFQPEESVVALAVRPGREEGQKPYVGLAMRIDIADLVDVEHGHDACGILRPHMENDGAVAVLLALYSKTNPASRTRGPGEVFSPQQLRDLLEKLRGQFDDDLPLNGFWVVTPQHFYEVTDGQIPPPDEWELAKGLASTQSAVAAVYRGDCVAPNREALGDIPRAEASVRDRAQRATLRWLEKRKYDGDRTWQIDSWQLWEEAIEAQIACRVVGAGQSPTSDPLLLGRLQAALDDIRIRDAVMISNIPGIGDLPGRSVSTNAREEVGKSVDLILDPEVAASPGESAEAITDILRAIYGHCARSRATPALTLLAWLAWWGGDGARGAVLADRALKTDPTYNMARLVDRMIELGLPPGWVKREREMSEVG